ncbi:MAG: YmaF family protein, partial [Acidobacteriota bacterium]
MKDLSQHVHQYLGDTEYADGHDHEMAGVTKSAVNLSNGRHYHRLPKSNTNWVDFHIHQYDGKTGLDIDLPSGEHTHFIKSK